MVKTTAVPALLRRPAVAATERLANATIKRLHRKATRDLPPGQAEFVLKLAAGARSAPCHPIAKHRSVVLPECPNRGNEIRLALPAGAKHIRGTVSRGLVEF